MATTLQVDRRQADVFEAIVSAIRQTGRPPTVRELCEATGITSTSVLDYHLWRLERAGKIRRDAMVARGLWPVVADGCCPMCGGTGRIG